MNVLCRSTAAVVVAAVLFTAGAGFRTTVATGRDIMEKSLAWHAVGSQAEFVKMVTVDRIGNVTERQLLRIARETDDGTRESLLYFLAPEDIKGTALLTLQPRAGKERQYLYLSAMGEVREVAGQGRKALLLGSDFALEDVMREDPEDFEYNRLSYDVIDGQNVVGVAASPANEAVRRMTNYGKRLIWMTTEDHRILKVELYDHDEKLVKTLRMEEFKPTGEGEHAQYPVRAQMSHARHKTSSTFIILNASHGNAIPDRYFTVEGFKALGDADLAKLMELAGPGQD